MRLGFPIAALMIVAAMFDVAVAADDEAKLRAYGRHLAQECTSCHRIDGAHRGIPSIIGLNADQFAATMKFYQTGARSNPVMVSVAKSLDDQQVRALALYFASLAKPSAKGEGKSEGEKQK
jgi:cytochrome c553